MRYGRRARVEVHGSRWPILLAYGITLFLVGLIAPPFLFIGLALLAFSAYGWIRDDARALVLARGQLSAGERSDRWYAMAIFITAEAVLFGMLFFYFFWARAYAAGTGMPWPPPGVHFNWPVIATSSALLLSSGVTAHFAAGHFEAGRRVLFRVHMAATMLFGAVFVSIQGYEYLTADFSPSSHSFGTAFFALTGTHGGHVVLGLLVLSGIWYMAEKGVVTRRRPGPLSAAVLYWHFVDVVWLLLLATVYTGVL